MAKQETQQNICQLVTRASIYGIEAAEGVGLGAAAHSRASKCFQSSPYIFMLNNYLKQTLGLKFYLVLYLFRMPHSLVYGRPLLLA